MLYQRSLDIERRLDTVLRMVRSGDYSTPLIAMELGVSIPTVSRYLTALRERGHDIRSAKKADGWRYVLDRQNGQHRKSHGRKFAEAQR
jgi:biotin operon repressor